MGTGTAEKEELNMLREVMMNKAIHSLRECMEETPQQLQQEILARQRREKAKRDQEAMARNGRVHREGEFEMKCGKCGQFICMSDEIRVIQRAHHAIVCQDLLQRCNAQLSPEKYYIDNTGRLKSGAGKLMCKSCDHDLGVISLYDNAQFAIPKIGNFTIEDIRGNVNTYPRWKKVPFGTRDISEEEVQERLKGEKYIDL